MSLMSQIDDALHKVGLSLRGGLHIASEDGVETIYLVGHGGSSFWPYFKSSQYIDLEENPLDNWSKHVVGQLARDIGCSAIFPSDGPPYAPFQQWVMQAEPVKQSPIGLVLHPEFGLWHAYRAALKVSGKHELP
ncbi:MAG: hypothetical protein R3261_04205, partial [Alphaproteobacteria bacterium]|nr:hypothetical protein [Alphaproteobacteria bacterium]